MCSWLLLTVQYWDDGDGDGDYDSNEEDEDEEREEKATVNCRAAPPDSLSGT